MVQHCRRVENAQRALEQGGGSLDPADRAQQHAEIAERERDVGMIRTDQPFTIGERPAIVGLGEQRIAARENGSRPGY
jgi:hypothetical protein